MKKLTMAVLAMLALGATSVAAQSANGAASVTIPTVLVITNVTDLTIAEGAFDFSAGNTSQASGAVTIDTRSNVLHAVDVTGSDLTNGGDNLALEVQGSDASWSTLSATAVKAVANLNPGTQAGNAINFRTTADVSLHAPGEYTGTITYTVVANY
jgi:hypothetical protein